MPRSVDLRGESLLLGLADGTIMEKKNVISNQNAPLTQVLIRSHFDGEAWGLTSVDIQNRVLFFTCGDDDTILLYDADERKCIGEGKVAV